MAFTVRRPTARPALVLAAALALSSVVAPTTAAASSPTEVLSWNRIAASTLAAFPPPAGGAPPATAVHMAMTEAAVYDAVNAIDRQAQPYLLQATFPGASIDAAVATASHRMLTFIIGSVPGTIGFPNRTTLQANVDVAAAQSLGAIPASQAKTDGIAAGNAAADAMIAARQNDGRFGPSQWDPDQGVDHWWPLSNPDGSPILDATPWVGGVRPFTVASSSQFRTDGPNDITSAQYAADFNEVKALGRSNSTVRTAEQTHQAIFWQGSLIAAWNEAVRSILADPDHRLDAAQTARLFAMFNTSGADALINCWNDKYHWDFLRPWNAIARAGDDGNPATEADPTWQALITAPYPEHPSGHLCYDGSSVEVLQKFFGTDKIQFQFTSIRFPGEVRTFDRLSDLLKEITEARIWAGLHFRTADMQGQNLGRKVAHYIEKHAFQPLD